MSVLRIPKDADRALAERNQIRQLTTEVERKLGRGAAINWGLRDFEFLSKAVEAASGQPISVTTLKRVHGRATYEGLPGLFTLNQLAQYAGYAGWNSFCNQEKGHSAVLAAVNEKSIIQLASNRLSATTIPTKLPGIGLGIGVGLVLALMVFFGYHYFKPMFAREPTALPETELKAVLTAELTPEVNLPKHVKFVYKGARLPGNRLNIISFGNGNMKPISIDSQGVAVTNCLYTKPGVYVVRVFSNKATVATVPVVVESSGWNVFTNVYNQDIPTPTHQANGTLFIDGKQTLKAIRDTGTRYHTKLINYGDFRVSGDRFEFSTRFRIRECNLATSDLATSLRISGTHQNMMFQFANRILLRGMYVQVSEYSLPINSPEQNRFLLDLEKWHNLTITNRNDTLLVLVDGKKQWQHTYREAIGNLSGLEFSFAGSAEVDYISIKNGDLETVHHEGFD